jgi:hypothetical protein
MTPEEQWIQINNAIRALTDVQSKHDERLDRLTEQVQRNAVSIEKTTLQSKNNDAQIEKNAAAIRDLIVVSRTIVDSQLQTNAQLDRLETIVEAFIKSLQKPNGLN